MNFEKKRMKTQVHNIYAAPYNVQEILDDALEQEIPGQIVISLPGNGGVTAIEFREKERVHPMKIVEVEDDSI